MFMACAVMSPSNPYPRHRSLPVFLLVVRYALAAEVGGHRLRAHAELPEASPGRVVLGWERGGARAPAAAATAAGVGVGVGGGSGGGGGGGGIQPAIEAAAKPWGCTALEGLFLNGQGVVRATDFVLWFWLRTYYVRCGVQ